MSMTIPFNDLGLPVPADLRGLHAARPAATAVPIGTTYWSVDEPSAPGTVFVTDGTNWTTVTEL